MPQVRSRRINGNLAYWSTHQKRILDGTGEGVVKFITDFTSFPVDDTTGDPTEYTSTVVEAGSGNTTIASTDKSGGAVLITTAANENDGGSYQLLGESFKTDGNELYFGTSIATNEATQSDVLIGLSVTDTALLGGLANGIYFECVDGGTGISAVTESGSSETQSDSLGTLADDTFVELEFYYNGSNVEFFINGSSVATHTATIPSTEMRVSFEYLTGAAAAKTMTLDWIRCIQFGR
tara:strand:- start:681 stop:1391 length:711 start_codon:yes stop_codon:yes gene_type:complete